MKAGGRTRRGWFLAGLLMAGSVMAVPALSAGDAGRGEYLFHAAGCKGCHTRDVEATVPLAGGRALETPFGTFRSPNITPDPEQGIGRWSQADFVTAMREGRAPDGSPYYPVFPYTSYAGMNDRDLADLWAYLKTVPASDRKNAGHDLEFPVSVRSLMGVWQWMYFDTQPFRPDPARDARWNRGAYLVRHVAHCGECHTPRTTMGARNVHRELAGARLGPDESAPNITPHPDDGIGDWDRSDIAFYLEIGFDPDGDSAGGRMAEVIRESTGRMTPADREAIAIYLESLPPRPAEVESGLNRFR